MTPDFSAWSKAWALLDARERRNAWFVLVIIIIGALAAAVMVGSVMPFLTVLANPSRIESTPLLAWAYQFFGFTSTHGFLIALGTASFLVIVLSSLVQILKIWVVARFSTMRMHSISKRLLARYLSQPYVFFLDRHSGEMGPRILAETEQVVTEFLRPAGEMIAAILTIIAILGLLLWVDPVIAIVSIILLGSLFGLVNLTTRRILKGLGKRRVEFNHQRFRFANEALSGIKSIKVLGRENAYLQRYAGPSRQMAQVQSTARVLSEVPLYTLQAVALGGVILLCLLLLDADGLDSGSALADLIPMLGVFAFAGQRLMPEFSKFYLTLAKTQVGAAAVETIHADLIKLESTHPFLVAPPAPLGLKDSLTLENVSFGYPRAERAGLRDVSLTIRAGEKIGVVGATGAGKTTLADILLGILEPDEGRLVADKVVITRDKLPAWTQTVGYVPQDIFLTDASVIENIALGLPPAQIDLAQIERAAKAACIDAFIKTELPQGYETPIGERGVRLSGGQRQRMGIARALYRDADLIVFDEATSALDNLTEQEVIQAIEALPGEKTVVMIAHRLTTVQGCDRIIVLDKGQLVGFDTWDGLMRDSGAFRRIVNPEKCA